MKNSLSSIQHGLTSWRPQGYPEQKPKPQAFAQTNVATLGHWVDIDLRRAKELPTDGSAESVRYKDIQVMRLIYTEQMLRSRFGTAYLFAKELERSGDPEAKQLQIDALRPHCQLTIMSGDPQMGLSLALALRGLGAPDVNILILTACKDLFLKQIAEALESTLDQLAALDSNLPREFLKGILTKNTRLEDLILPPNMN